MEQIIFHIDVNNAFLSWSAIDLLQHGFKKDIRNSYAVIGGDETKRRGIVLAKSMLAKKRGIVTGESLYEARRKCSWVEVYSPNYHFYQEKSNQLFTLLSAYTDDIEVASIDECYLDYGKIKHIHGDEVTFAYALKDRIKKELGFTVNIGIARNKLCAKMASDFTKPDKVHTLYPDEIEAKMWPLPISELYGVGKKSTVKLIQLGIHTIGDLAQFDHDKLYKYFKNQAIRMIESANGIHNEPVISVEGAPKGISNETTLSYDVTNKEELHKYIMSLTENVCIRLRQQKKYAYVVAIIIKDKFFKRKTHQKKLINPTNLTSEITAIAINVFDEMWHEEGVRLIGVRVDNLVDEQKHQVSLFENLEERDCNHELEKTMDELKEKYGYKIIKKASLIDSKVEKKYL